MAFNGDEITITPSLTRTATTGDDADADAGFRDVL